MKQFTGKVKDKVKGKITILQTQAEKIKTKTDKSISDSPTSDKTTVLKNENGDSLLVHAKSIWSNYTIKDLLEMCKTDEKWDDVTKNVNTLLQSLANHVPILTSQNNNMELASEKKDETSDDKNDIKMEDLSCSICLNLFADPITLPCGHTFCRVCVMFALQKNNKQCPNCHAICHINPLTHHINATILNLIKTYFNKQYQQRIVETKPDKEKLLKCILPCFILNQLSLPNQQLSLHLPESRYSHLINRSISKDCKFVYLPKFVSPYSPNINDIGLLVNIEDCEFLRDGKCLMKGKSIHRVIITEAWIEKDTQGLWYVKYEYFDDQEPFSSLPIQEKDNKIKSMTNMIDVIEKFVNQFYNQNNGHISKLEEKFGKKVILNNFKYNEWNFNNLTKENIDILTQWSFFIIALLSNLFNKDAQQQYPLFATNDIFERTQTLYNWTNRYLNK